MLDSVRSLKGYRMEALDGVIGSVNELFSDDQYRHYGHHGYWADEPAPVAPPVW